MNIRKFSNFLWFTLATVLLCHSVPVLANPEGETTGLSPRMAADYIHAVIQADRRVYADDIVDRLAKRTSLRATEHWKQENTLLLPAQFLLMASKISNEGGIGMKYRLTSLWPINKKNSPKSEIERLGLQEVSKNPEEPFTWIVKVGGIWYFQAVYPDTATSDSCASCHNQHPDSPRNDFKLGDVMGGILINLPLGRHGKKSESEKNMLPPEVVSDYVHSILEADRTIYSKHVVDRLKNNNIMEASEHWWLENSLPLPAQFLLKASQLVEKNRAGVDFRLISLWPIHSRNGPANEFERKGLEFIDIHPVRPFIGKTRIGKKQFFQAIYPDFAVTPGCVQCHNSHPKSPRKDFKLNDVMGGIVVTLDLK
ncbi:MAG: DUF3365 domain-containing protein [Nitrospinaceae bacterium]